MFEDMGFTYLGPVNGHDLDQLITTLAWARELGGPVLMHVRTRKGKGYGPAEAQPERCHGVSPFDPAKGPSLKRERDFSYVFGHELVELAGMDKRLCAVTAAMGDGTGLQEFAAAWPKRFFDVGIAEGHAVAMAAGMAKQGLRPVFAVYSSFLQRGFDMLLHDVALQGLPVVLAVDRAGLVGADGPTHHGCQDVALSLPDPGDDSAVSRRLRPAPRHAAPCPDHGRPRGPAVSPGRGGPAVPGLDRGGRRGAAARL